MPMLGDLLAAARRSSGGFEQWLKQSDPELSAQVARAALAQDLTPTGYVRVAIADFTRFAAEEDWATLTSSLRDTDDPGTICLLGMVHWRLTVRGCSDHSMAAAPHEEGRAHERVEPGPTN